MYNGPSYWQNRYDIKLAEQFQRFASGSLPNLEMRTAQVALLFLGYAPGKIDGVIGPRTRAAIKNFPRHRGAFSRRRARRTDLSGLV
jgi:hypothetical protein